MLGPVWQNGWLWISASALIALIEVILPGWAFVSLGAAVAVMGAVMLAGVWPAGLPMTLLVTAGLTAIIWVLLWRVMPEQRGSVRVWRTDINER